MAYRIYRFDSRGRSLPSIEHRAVNESFAQPSSMSRSRAEPRPSTPTTSIEVDIPYWEVEQVSGVASRVVRSGVVRTLRKADEACAEPFLGSSVWLRVVSGERRDEAFMHLSGDATLAVGSGRDCGLRLRPETLPELAFELRFLGDTLFVRATSSAELWLDRDRVGAIWTPVHRGARICVAGVVLEVGLGS